MIKNYARVLRIFYYTVLSVLLVTLAGLLMAACVTIYRSGPAPFTREVVAEHLGRVAVPIYVCLGLVAVGFLLHPLLPSAPESDRDRNRMMVRRLRRHVQLSLCPAPLAEAVRKEQAGQRRHRWITLCLLALGGLVTLWYALSFDRFSMEDINGSMVRFMRVLIPALLLPAGYGVFSLFYNRRCYVREIALLRQAPPEAKTTAPETKEAVWLAPLRNAILLVALGLIVVGWGTGGWVDVLTKAINICTECIGLG